MSLRQRETKGETKTEADHATKKGHKGDRRKRGGDIARIERAHTARAQGRRSRVKARERQLTINCCHVRQRFDETKATNSEGVCHIQRDSKLISRVEIRTADSITASLYF